MSENKRIIPEQWFFFEDWLKERADKAKQTAVEVAEPDECSEHYEFVRREWIAFVADTILCLMGL